MATGTLVPALNIEVGSVLSGQVSKLLVDFNDKVRTGQVLAELDDRSYALAVDASRAALEGSRFEIKSYEARLKRAILDLWQTEHQLPVFQARVDAAKIALETAEREFKRKQWLQEREVAATADVQNIQSRRDAATSALREAEANLANQTGLVSAARADVDTRARRTRQCASDRDQARSAVAERMRLILSGPRSARPSTASWSDATSPRAQTLATGLEAKTLFIIAGDLDSMEINARINESDIAGIKDGQDATFTVDAFPGRLFSAKVKQIRMAPQVLSNVVTYTVVLKTANPDGMLLPGMTVMANIVTQRTPAAHDRADVGTALSSANRGRLRPRRGLPSPLIRFGCCGTARPFVLPVVKGEEDGKKVVVSSEQLRPTDVVIVGEKNAKSPRATRRSLMLIELRQVRALLPAGTDARCRAAVDLADDLSRRVRRHPRSVRIRKVDPDEHDGSA